MKESLKEIVYMYLNICVAYSQTKPKTKNLIRAILNFLIF